MSKTKKNTTEYNFLITITPMQLVANRGFEDNPMSHLKKLVKDTAVSHEIVKDTLAELEVKVWCACKDEKEHLETRLAEMLVQKGYPKDCLAVCTAEEKAEIEKKQEKAWNDFMEFALTGEDKGPEGSKEASSEDSDKVKTGKSSDQEDEVTEEEIDAMFAELERKFAEMDKEAEAKAKPEKRKPAVQPKFDTRFVLEEIEGLQGAENFKKYARALSDSAEYFRDYDMQDSVFHRCLLFMVEDGDGFSTYLDLLSRHLTEIGLLPKNDWRVKNEVSNLPFDEYWLSIIGRSCSRVNLLGLDLASILDKLGTKEFREFLRMISEAAKPCWVVFRIPVMDELSKKKIEEQLSVYFAVESIDIPVMSLEHYLQVGLQYAEKLGYEVNEDVYELLEQSIWQEKADQKFYGFKTVIKVMEEIIYQKNLAESTDGDAKETDFVITAEDVKRVLKHYEAAENADTLDDLIGMESIKEKIDEIVAQIMLNKSMGKSNTSSLHMRFLGNPGTGKTTVARLIGKLLKEKGVLSKGQFFEYKGRDLVGRYIGETTPKTAGICRDAYGSILFIDEAYTLFKGTDNERDYGPEALAELITHMENHREDFMVIMAGYTDDMAKLMEGNLGLESRMPYEIMFDNYTQEQLYEIFLSMGRKDYIYTDGLKKVAEEYFANIPDEVIAQKEFANARFVRNLFERTVAKAALRLQMEPQDLTDGKVVLVEGDFAKASNDREFQKMQEKKKPTIGFY